MFQVKLGMDSYTAIQELSEEVFGHLCSLAVDKCNDKMEKRKAGCGGRAMRKRYILLPVFNFPFRYETKNGLF